MQLLKILEKLLAQSKGCKVFGRVNNMMRKIIGLKRKKVRLLSYNPVWKNLYAKEVKLLRSVIG